jgi:hypothetical protein
VKRSWFHPPVAILLGRHVRRVNSLEIASETLMGDDWPLHDWSYQRAAEMLLKALDGKATREEARLAFEAAARKADVLVH